MKKQKDQEPELFTSGTGRRFILLSETQERSPLGVPLAEPLVRAAFPTGEEKVSLELVEFDRKKVIASLDEGKPVIPVWLDQIYQKLALKLGKS
ncbi:hypothetical protein B4U84_21300 [Westiellopsis prolifica IICB1]|nr:hypothetical protein B4U84_21300 [Westiellopsis prolifica IICB1]